ncbi:hypothetical protein PsorP6_015823 [Peronosclerospora sorghi]|uniref:Uncharacterized protein n=1 Tax=Peronosclerospora sorghi TaxID=230839 RepID=A0ACC0WLY5_9STRA|nr:hypothetical protein PsorP6_015823 [Peronosclerospora sorghi]
MAGDGVEDNDDSEEPDPTRLRLTEGYDIALAVMDIPRTYNEAMASPQAYKWKEPIRHELRMTDPNPSYTFVNRNSSFGSLKSLDRNRRSHIATQTYLVRDLNKRYRELIGSMLYIANGTRPDICVSIYELSQHLEATKPSHMKAAIRVLSYHGGTSKFGLCYSRNDKP